MSSPKPGWLDLISRQTIITWTCVVAWYVSNIGVLLLNKALLSSKGFRQPIFLTGCHMVACTLLGVALSLVGITPPVKRLASQRQLGKIFVLAAIFCVTIVAGNASLNFIPISFNQAVGATTPFFTAMMAFAVLGQRESPYTYYALAPICIGVVIASGGEPQFHALGFALCLGSAAGRAMKSVVQSALMTDPTEKIDPMSLLVYMSAFSVLLLAPMVVFMEPRALAEAQALIAADKTFIAWLVSNSAIAYAVNLTNFLVTKYTSALTLQVLGNAKGVVAAAVSVAIFKNVVTWQGCLGYSITMAGVYWYSESKRWAKAQALAAKEDSSLQEPLLAGQGGSPGSNAGAGISSTAAVKPIIAGSVPGSTRVSENGAVTKATSNARERDTSTPGSLNNV